ncbi:MAG: transglutaminaseTgpA domain-containing protein [Acidimicrobiales bacterium]
MTRPPRSLLPAAEAALAGVTFFAVIKVWKLFEPGPFLGRLMLILLAAHLTMVVTRRLGWELWAVAPTALVGAVLSLTWVLYPDTTQFLLPTRATFDTASADLSEAWSLFQNVRAPAPVLTGFLLTAGAAIWAVAFIGDWAAFRVWVPFEAIVPAGTMFVFASLFSAPGAQFLNAAMFGAAVLGFILFHRVARQQASASWLPSHIREGTGALLGSGATLVVVAVLVGGFFAPFLPGAKSDPVYDYRDRGGGAGPRVVLSPFVSVANQLNQLANVEMFTVTSTHRSYWRITSLERFDGAGWTYRRDFQEASGDLPQAHDPEGASQVATQEFRIHRLGEIFMPAAYRAVAVRDERYPTRWERESGTLVIDEEYEDSDGNRYTVISELPRLEADLLRTANTEIPGDIADVYLRLPANFSDQIHQLAEEVTGSQATPFDRALALQQFFRSDQFSYDQDVDPGAPEGAMEQFLFETRRGFCQQFSGTFAAMARAVGLPARVATGFTTGEENPSDPGVYHVSGSHAHAWPEIYLGQFGWVPFEPTPGRGPAGADYMGVAEEQAIANDPSTATTRLPGVDVPALGDVPEVTLEPRDPTSEAGTPGADEGFDIKPWLRNIAVGVLAIVGVMVLFLGGIATSRIIGRRQRRWRARDADQRVRTAWWDSVEAAEMLGVISRPWETHAEYARRAQAVVDGGSFSALADVLGSAEFSADGVSDHDAAEAHRLTAHIEREARHRASREQRLRSIFDPRPPERWPTVRKGVDAGEVAEPVLAGAPRIAVLEGERDDEEV